MTLTCIKRLKVEREDIVLPVKVNFVEGFCQAAQIAKNLRFKVTIMKFEKIFTICELGGVDVVLENTFLQYYEVAIRQRYSVHIVMVGLY